LTEIVMPRLSDSMESGLVLQWLIEEGQPVREGEELVEIETDKATMTYAAEAEGILEIVVPAGTTVAVGEPIARLGEAAAPVVGSADRNGAAGAASLANGRARVASLPLATPVARRLAAKHGVELDCVEGSGPRGRVTKHDVLRAAGIRAPAPPAPAPPAPAPPAPAPAVPVPGRSGAESRSDQERRQELTRLQAVIARRMSESMRTVPHFQVQADVEMDGALALRAQLKASSPEGAAVPSVNDLIVKAAALALVRHPLANGSYADDGFRLHERVNVGVAVAAEGALIVPVIFDADTRSLGALAAETRRLAERVRAGSITPAELDGATFTVSNLGMYGMRAITPVIDPPQAAILGVGAARAELARLRDGEIVERTVLTLTLSCDHRILYGADAARFLGEIRDLLQEPLRLCL
jgi:pyruvate dehydrogenase E2 component (dihydrolipoamide acetyltransferase)